MRDQPYDFHRFRVLILEDSKFIGKIFSGALRSMGFGAVMLAQTVAEAKELILRHNDDDDQIDIDLVMTDWLLPDGMGFDFIRWMRSHKKDSIKFMPVIVCSAYASADLVVQSRDCGATEVLVKPISAEKIAQRILYILDRQRPFVQLHDYFGPDRRRRQTLYGGKERRVMKSDEMEIEHEGAI